MRYLTLVGNNTLTSSDGAGLKAPYGANLTIGGTGSLTAAAGDGSHAGIGGANGGPSRKITITGGTITASGSFDPYSSQGGAAIGIGNFGYSSTPCGSIIITGGVINVVNISTPSASNAITGGFINVSNRIDAANPVYIGGTAMVSILSASMHPLTTSAVVIYDNAVIVANSSSSYGLVSGISSIGGGLTVYKNSNAQTNKLNGNVTLPRDLTLPSWGDMTLDMQGFTLDLGEHTLNLSSGGLDALRRREEAMKMCA